MNIYLKTTLVLVFSFGLSFGMTKIAFYPDRAFLRPGFEKFIDNLISPVIGAKGEPVKVGVDVTPPATIYY